MRGVSESKQSGTLVFAAGLGGVVLKSTDDGATWCRLTSGTTADLLTIDAQSNTRVVVAGVGGVVRRTETGGGACQTTAVGDDARPQPADLTPYLRVQVDGGRVTLAAAVTLTAPFDVSVTDAAGRPVAGVAPARVAAGRHPGAGPAP